MGSGKNGSFDIHPDLNQWALLFTADNEATKAPQFLYRYWKFFRCDIKEFLLQPIAGHGLWDGKKVFGELFLVKDSTRKIKWKITDETREISGYNCRRANAIMMDSIYVVAFYTTDIPVSGGPESFNGLPGMILGVALPHENITWFATKVTDMTLAPNVVVSPKKGKPMDGKGFRDKMISAFKDWGSEAPLYSKVFSL